MFLEQQNQHIRMISEGSYDWRNGWWKFSIAIRGKIIL